jgi:hypothetical protein
MLRQYYSILSLFRDAVYSYQPTSWLGRAVLKTFPRSALVSRTHFSDRNGHSLTNTFLLTGPAQLVTSIHLTIVTPIPAVTWRAAARLSIQAAKWAHRLNLWSSSMGCGTMLLANLAMLVAWGSRTGESTRIVVEVMRVERRSVLTSSPSRSPALPYPYIILCSADLRFMPGYHYEPRKERAKLLAMHIMIATYSLAVFYRVPSSSRSGTPGSILLER